KNFPLTPDICVGPCSFTPLRRTALKRVKVTTRGQVQQIPAKRQNRGPGNSTGDGFKSWKSLMPNYQKLFFGTFLLNSN
ncbi:hypothetical protein ACU6XK_23960, partial [Klebsiella aerogenes]